SSANVQVPGGIHGDACGIVQLGAGGRAVVAAEACRPTSGHGRDHAVRNLADAMVVLVGDVQVAGGIHGDACGIVQLGAGGRAVVAAEACRPTSGHGRDHAVRNLADAMVVLVGDVQVAGGIHGDACGIVQLGAGGRAVVAAEACRPTSGHGRDHAVRNLADAMVVLVGDVQVAGGIHGDACGIVQLGAGGRAVVAAEACRPTSGHGRDHAVRNLADAMVVLVGDVQVAGGIHGDACGIVQLGAGGRAVVAAEACRPTSGHGRDHAVRNLADAMVVLVGDVQVAGGIHGDACGIVQLGAGGRAVVAAEACRPTSGHGRDHAVRNLADAMVVLVGDVQVAGGIHGDACGIVQLGAGGRAVVAAEACRPTSGHGRDHAVRNLADAMVVLVGDVQVAGGIHGDACGIVQLGAGGRAVVAAEACRPTSGHGRDHAVRNLADAMVVLVGDVQVAGGIHGDACGIVQLGAGGRAVVAAEACRPTTGHGRDHAVRNLADAMVVLVGDVQVAGGIHGDARGIVQLGAGGRAVVAAEACRPTSGHGRDHAVRNLADAMVVLVGDVQVAGGINGDARGIVQLGAGGRAVVADVAGRPIAGNGSDHPIRDLADAVITIVGNVQVAGWVHGDAGGSVQLGADGRAVVAAEALRPVSRHGGDHPIRNLADARVKPVGDVQVASRIHSDALGPGQLGAGGRAVVAAVAFYPGPRHQGQDSR